MNELGIIEINGLTKTYQVGNVPVHALRASTSRYGSGSLWQLSVLPALKVDPVPCAWGDAGYLRNGADQRTRSGGHERIGEGGSS